MTSLIFSGLCRFNNFTPLVYRSFSTCKISPSVQYTFKPNFSAVGEFQRVFSIAELEKEVGVYSATPEFILSAVRPRHEWRGLTALRIKKSMRPKMES